MDCSTTGFRPSPTSRVYSNSCPLAGDTIQSSHPLSSPSAPPSIFPSISIFSNESVLCIRRLKCHTVCMLSRFTRVQLCDLFNCTPPGSSVHGILQARILEWVAVPSFRGSSQPRVWTCISFISCIAGGFFIAEPPGMPLGITLPRFEFHFSF